MTNGDAILRNTEAYINKCAESRLGHFDVQKFRTVKWLLALCKLFGPKPQKKLLNSYGILFRCSRAIQSPATRSCKVGHCYISKPNTYGRKSVSRIFATIGPWSAWLCIDIRKTIIDYVNKYGNSTQMSHTTNISGVISPKDGNMNYSFMHECVVHIVVRKHTSGRTNCCTFVEKRSKQAPRIIKKWAHARAMMF